MKFIRIFIGLSFFLVSCVVWWFESKETSKPVESIHSIHSSYEGKPSQGNQTIENFQKAKSILRSSQIPNPMTFYCPCPWRDSDVLYGKSCQYTPINKHNVRAYRVEWEHIVPAETFGRHFSAWKNGDNACQSSQHKPYKGRRCAQKVSTDFKKMEADLYNLVPSIGEVNQLRGHKTMGYVPKSFYAFGSCSVKIDDLHIEPQDTMKGFVARTYLYMHNAYPSFEIIKKQEESLFSDWNGKFPVTEDEIKRAEAIEKIQGNRNTYVIIDSSSKRTSR